MTDLLKEAREYLDATKTATKDDLERGLWSYLTPTARRLIEDLVKEVEILKNHGIDLLDQYCSIAKHLENLALISNLQDAREYAKVKLEVFQTKDNQNDQ